MIVLPKNRGFICTTAHAAGCRENVKRQIETIKSNAKINGAKKVLIIGASTGYGLASRIASMYACDASTIGVIFEKAPSETKTATAGWYNTSAYEELAEKDGYYAKTINADAFSALTKNKVIQLIKQDLGKVDMVIYSLASPKRTTADGVTYSSVLKTVDRAYINKTIDLSTKKVTQITIEPATSQEIEDTVKVMGGEDWKDWIHALKDADAIEDGAVTLAYNYIGPELTHPIYLNGTIGAAKKHLYNTAKELTEEFKGCGIKAYISVNKAVVTQSSSAIPIVPLYIAALYKVMKAKNIHEGCIEQIDRLYRDKLFVENPVTDESGQFRIDDYEMREDVQREISNIWETVTDENVDELTDINGYMEDFFQMFGFNLPSIDYNQDINIITTIKGVQ